MKITRKQLNQLIKEEKQKLLRESDLEGLRDSLDSVNQLSFVLHDLGKGNAKEEDVLYYTSRAVSLRAPCAVSLDMNFYFLSLE